MLARAPSAAVAAPRVRRLERLARDSGRIKKVQDDLEQACDGLAGWSFGAVFAAPRLYLSFFMPLGFCLATTVFLLYTLLCTTLPCSAAPSGARGPVYASQLVVLRTFNYARMLSLFVCLFVSGVFA